MTREELEKKYLGLRVAVYSYEEREKARVISVTEEGFLKVVFDTGTKLFVHPKQVRLLKKKERRRVWVAIPRDESKNVYTFSIKPDTKLQKPDTEKDVGRLYIQVHSVMGLVWEEIKELIEFVEVRKK